jgi:hypothetical protein
MFYPYPTVRAGTVDASISVEGEPEGVSQLTSGSVAAAEAVAPFAVEIVLQFKLSRILAELNLQPSESGQVRLAVVESGIRSRTRRQVGSYPLESGGQVPIRLEFDPADYRGDIELQAFLVYTAGSDQRAGSRCGESERVIVHFDDFRSPPGSGMEIIWVDFTQLSEYSEIKGELFVLDLNKEPPALYLNESLTDFKSTLMSKGSHGSAARIRVSQFTLIGSQVLHTMLAEALGRLAELEEDGEGISGQLGGWREWMLTGWAPALLGDPDAGVGELSVAMKTHPDSLLMEVLPKQIQLHVAAGKSFAGLSGEFLDTGPPMREDGDD